MQDELRSLKSNPDCDNDKRNRCNWSLRCLEREGFSRLGIPSQHRAVSDSSGQLCAHDLGRPRPTYGPTAQRPHGPTVEPRSENEQPTAGCCLTEECVYTHPPEIKEDVTVTGLQLLLVVPN